MQESRDHTEAEKAPGDFVFRYALDAGRQGAPLYRNRPAELVRSALESLLNLVMLQHSGADVAVDGFRWLKGNGNGYLIFNGHSQAQ